MRFMLMMNTPAGTGDYQINDWSPEDFRAHMDFMHQFNRDIQASGEFVMGEGLTPPRDARLVRAGKDNTPITDGPFAESKEFLAGFWIIEAESAERAYELAARVSAAPGPRGKPLNMGIEVRPVRRVSPTEM